MAKTVQIDPFTVRRVGNGWMLTRLEDAVDGSENGYKTVYEDDPRHPVPPAESLSRCLREAVLPLLQDAIEGGISIHCIEKGRNDFDA